MTRRAAMPRRPRGVPELEMRIAKELAPLMAWNVANPGNMSTGGCEWVAWCEATGEDLHIGDFYPENTTDLTTAPGAHWEYDCVVVDGACETHHLAYYWHDEVHCCYGERVRFVPGSEGQP